MTESDSHERKTWWLSVGVVAVLGVFIVGFDLNEVCATEGDSEWNANVGARMLYKLCGAAAMAQPR